MSIRLITNFLPLLTAVSEVKVKVAPRYAPATGGVYSVTEVEVKPCEISVAYFTGEVPPGLPRYSPLFTDFRLFDFRLFD